MENKRFGGMDRRTFLKAAGIGAAAALSGPGILSAQTEVKKDETDSFEKIDMFCHILPRKYKETLFKKSKQCFYLDADRSRPALFDMDLRLKTLDKFEGLRQVLTLSAPPLEYVFSPKDAVELAQLANDEMAALVSKYPDRLIAAVASLPLNDVDASLREIERAVEKLNFKGIQVFSSVNGKPLDRPEFLGLFEKMAQYDLPIWLHPARDVDVPNYPDEQFSKYNLNLAFGWPYETTMAMSRLVYSGVLEKYPNLKIIAHHCGAMVPFFTARIQPQGQPGEIMKLTKPPLEYFKQFYGDTVLGDNTAALMCGHAFFGAEHMLFASDYPFPGGAKFYDAALGGGIKAVRRMDISDNEKALIFSKNARRMLKLS